MAGKISRYRDAGKRRAGGQSFYRRHRRPIVIALVTIVMIGAAGSGYAYMLNAKFKNIEKVNVKLNDKNRPDPDKGNALNIMLLGSDKGEARPGQSAKTDVAEDAKAATWPAGKYRSDTIMIVHISADRKHVYLVSVPRDSFVMLYDAQGSATHKEKINAAFSYYGPSGAVATLEHISNLRLKHLAIIDWAGFKDLSTAVGGVPVCIPREVYDDAQHKRWTAGEHLLKGKEALQYVRQRHGLLRGDFDRIARQQNFLRALMKKVLDSGTMHNPIRLNNTLEALTRNLTVDSAWTPGDMRGLALSLRGTQASNVTFMTVPILGTSTDPTYGSIVNIDPIKSRELFVALRADSVEKYLAQNPDLALKPDRGSNAPSAPPRPTAETPSSPAPQRPAACNSAVS